MSELSSLLFVNTDELGRPTGLVASNEEDNLASALMPQDVKDTVFVVSSSKVSSNYTAWDSVSAVSGLQELSGVSADALPRYYGCATPLFRNHRHYFPSRLGANGQCKYHHCCTGRWFRSVSLYLQSHL